MMTVKMFLEHRTLFVVCKSGCQVRLRCHGYCSVVYVFYGYETDCMSLIEMLLLHMIVEVDCFAAGLFLLHDGKRFVGFIGEKP